MADIKISNPEKLDNPRWKEFIKHEPNNIDCQHCKYANAENSIPKKEFTVMEQDENDVLKSRVVKEIKIKYGSHDDVEGWIWQ